MNIVEEIRNSIIKECLNSPMLVNDMANMEKYISESYSGRSLIELMQNADDAGANRLLVKKTSDKCYMIANDGRIFNENDLISLCRSGASTKKRKGGTIGYRGIGFKSVVNYSSRVHLISGQMKITFSREMTKDELNNAENVPLVRLPHVFNSNLFANEICELQNEGYNTIFVFETKSSAIEDELKNFDSSCLLFLNNLQSVVFEIDENVDSYRFSKEKKEEDINLIKLIEENKTEEWLVISNNKNVNKVNAAFRYENGRVVEFNSAECVVHSFMPTKDKIDTSMKLNGDFSTDPSRTRIVNDECTNEALEECSKLVSQKIIDIFTNRIDKYGLMKVLSKLKVDPMSKLKGWNFNDNFVSVTIDKLKKFIRTFYSEVSGYYIQSPDMDNKDFENILLKVNACGVGKKDEKSIPGILEICKQLGFTKIPYSVILEAMRDIDCSENTKVSTVVDIIESTRFGLDEGIVNRIKSAKLFSFSDGSTTLGDNPLKGALLNDKFEGAIRDKLSAPAELDRFAKKIGISLSANNKIETGIELIDKQDSVKFIKSDVIKKWRKAEINFSEVISSFDEVEKVEDVSEKNFGYDVLAVLKNGENRYYEVKSVDRLGESFC